MFLAFLTDTTYIIATDENSSLFILRGPPNDEFMGINENKTEGYTQDDIWLSEPYPNPSLNTAKFNVYWNIGRNPNNIQFKLYNINGELVRNLSKMDIIRNADYCGFVLIDTSSLLNGIYFLDAILNGYSFFRKFLINK